MGGVGDACDNAMAESFLASPVLNEIDDSYRRIDSGTGDACPCGEES